MKRIAWVLLAAMILLAMPFLAIASDVTIPESTTTIDDEAFCGASITTVVFPESVQTIGSKAFADCDKLKAVYMPTGEISISIDAFSGSDQVVLYVYSGSAAHTWALSNGVPYQLVDAAESFLDASAALIAANGKPAQVTQSGSFGTMRLIVQMKNNAMLPNVSAYSPSAILEGGSGLYVLQFSRTLDTENCYNALKAQEGAGISYVEEDLYLGTELDKVGGSSASRSSSDPMGFAEYASYVKEKNGNGSVTVAVIDSGVGNHSILNGRVRSDGRNFVDSNGSRYDGHGHGTKVATIIAECTGDNHVQILPVRVIDDAGTGFLLTIGNGIEYAINKNVAVINLSLNFEESSYIKAKLAKAQAKGITVVVAAGNNKMDCSGVFPANVSSCVTVAAVQENGAGAYERWSGSNYGSSVDYCAPGVNIQCGLPGGGLTTGTGTSFAAPHIAAAYALNILDPNHSVSDMQNTCLKIGSGLGKGMPILSDLATEYVTSISVGVSPAAVMKRGEYYAGLLSIHPANATNRSVTVTSSNSNVVSASISSDGILMLVTDEPGTAEIVITANDGGGAELRFTITVVQQVDSISISYDGGNTIYLGQVRQLYASALPANAADRTLAWTSSNTAIADVSSSGLVTPKSAGTVTITATAKDGYGASASVTFSVEKIPDPVSVTIPMGESLTLRKGTTVTLMATVSPAEADQKIVWKSASESIATVTADGVLTAVSSGTTAVTATAVNNVYAILMVTVNQPATGIQITGGDAVDVGSTLQLTAHVYPADADNKTVLWKSSDLSVATVTSTGIVTGISKGQVKITATSADQNAENVSASTIVTVKPIEFSVIFDPVCEGVTIAPITALVGKPLGELPVPVKPYHTFLGWFTAKDGGSQVTSSSMYATAETITLYAHWQLNAESDWVLASEVPANAEITNTKWVYTETVETNSSTLPGYTLQNNFWKETGSGSVRSVDFANKAPGFSKSNELFKTYNVTVPTASETETNKRVVTSENDGYIYWHWMYDCGGASAGNRAIFYKNATGTSSLTGNDYYYKYFNAHESTSAYTKLGDDMNWGQNYTLYAWYMNKNSYTSNSASGGSYYWYRLQIVKYSYVDYEMYYTHAHEVESFTEPIVSDTITNVRKYVKYRAY